MTKYIKGKDGKFVGSIGDGKTKVPTAAPTISSQGSPEDSSSQIDSTSAAWSKYQEQTLLETRAYGPINEVWARFALTMGECHNLAIAAHRETGLPLIAFSPWSEEDSGTTGTLVHVGVLTEDGYVLDGHGTTALRSLEEDGHFEGTVLENEEELLAWIEQDTSYGTGEWLPVRPEEFKGYVTDLLKEHEEVNK
jgi:hypothetical protein